MSGILGGIANLAGALSQGQDQQNQAKVQTGLQVATLARQQHQLDVENALKQAQTGEANARAQTYTPEYAGQKAGEEAAAEQPFKEQQLRAQLENGLTLERAHGATEQQIAASRIAGEKEIESMRIGSAAALQQKQQQFQSGQDVANRTAAANRTQTEVRGRLQLGRQTQSGQVLPSLVHGVKSWWGGNDDPPTEQQSHYDAAADALTAQGVDPVSKLGPRP